MAASPHKPSKHGDVTNIGGDMFSTTGELTKLGGGIKTWKRRVFGLQKASKTLYYFKGPDELKEYVKTQKKNYKGTIELKDARLYISDYPMDQQHCAEIATPQRIFFIVADSREALLVWIAAIGNAGIPLKTPVPLPNLIGVQCLLAKHGFLQKRGQWNVSWQIRFFRTNIKDGKHVLEYYDYLEEHKLRGLIMITGSEITENKDKDQIADFTVKCKERDYILRAKDEAEKKEWVQVLKALAKGQLWPDGVSATPASPKPTAPLTPAVGAAAAGAGAQSAAQADAQRRADTERKKFEEEKRKFEEEKAKMEQMRAQMAAEKKRMEEEQASLRESMSQIERQRQSMGSQSSSTSPTHSGSVSGAHGGASAGAANGAGTGGSPLASLAEVPQFTYQHVQPMAVSPQPQPQPQAAAAGFTGGVPPPPPSGFAPLPAGWSEHTAPNGQKYYYNEQTQVSTFERPN